MFSLYNRFFAFLFALLTPPAMGMSSTQPQIPPPTEIPEISMTSTTTPTESPLVMVTENPTSSPPAMASVFSKIPKKTLLISLSPTRAALTTATITPSHAPSRTPSPSQTNMPTPPNSPTQASKDKPLTSQQLDAWFDQYSAQFGIDRKKLWLIAVCESGLNPKASFKDYGGLYQFAPSTWKTIRNQMHRDPNPDLRFDAEESIQTAAYKISQSGYGAWPACSSKF